MFVQDLNDAIARELD